MSRLRKVTRHDQLEAGLAPFADGDFVLSIEHRRLIGPEVSFTKHDAEPEDPLLSRWQRGQPGH